jgi:hypothetical protein
MAFSQTWYFFMQSSRAACATTPAPSRTIIRRPIRRLKDVSGKLAPHPSARGYTAAPPRCAIRNPSARKGEGAREGLVAIFPGAFARPVASGPDAITDRYEVIENENRVRMDERKPARGIQSLQADEAVCERGKSGLYLHETRRTQTKIHTHQRAMKSAPDPCAIPPPTDQRKKSPGKTANAIIGARAPEPVAP